MVSVLPEENAILEVTEPREGHIFLKLMRMENQSRQPLISFLNYLSFFEALSPAFIHELETHCKKVQIPAQSLYFNKGEFSHKIGFLEKGTMRIFDLDESGRDWTKVFLAPPGIVVGNADIEVPSIHYIESLTNCELIELPKSFFDYAVNKFPEVREIQNKIVYSLFKKKETREYDFQTLTAKERYLKFVRDHSQIAGEIQQYHIASYLGITPTQLSRIKYALADQQM